MELTKVCNRVWAKEKVPEDWNEGISIPIPKRGTEGVHELNRHYTAVDAGKVMTAILVNQNKNAVHKKLRQEQPGFRPGKLCCEQIFTPIYSLRGFI